MAILLLPGLTLTELIVGQNEINRMVGAVLCGLCVLQMLKWRMRIPAELVLFAGFILWSTVTGAIVAIDQAACWTYVRLLVQIWFLALAITTISALRRSSRVVWIALVVSGCVLVVYGLATGNFAVAAVAESNRSRATSFLANPNKLGFLMLFGIVALFLFWERARTPGARFTLVGLAIVFAFALLYSGSRKAFIGLVVFVAAWIWFCYRSELLRRPSLFLMVGVLLLGTYWLSTFMMENTFMGARFNAALQEPDLSPGRVQLYWEGLDMFRQNPVAGVGLGNFVVYSSSGLYAHSDYMEALATTGMVGFILYFSLYPMLWFRMNRIVKAHADNWVTYDVGILKAALVVLFVVGTGRPNFLDPSAWYVVAGAIGCTSALEQHSRTATRYAGLHPDQTKWYREPGSRFSSPVRWAGRRVSRTIDHGNTGFSSGDIR